MAHKTFISYKYSESRDVRDRIIKSLGNDASYYLGETSDSPDLTDLKTDRIKEYLKNMIYSTSVLIVILSPNMTESNWIDWEIEYALKKIKRNDRTSNINGIVAVLKKVNGNYSWIKSSQYNIHGVETCSYDLSKIFKIIGLNHFNSIPPKYHCNKCKSFDYLNGSYITFVEEDDFLESPSYHIDNAFDKSKNDGKGYNLVRKR
ncbi:TIR domain-containing protein [Streptococcus suis]|nr:TIR domain-containing protein [Streptococcus suis]